jgi:hypothetical protein
MPKVKISEFSSTPANNTDIDSINIAEGCAPSGINDAIRELMAQLKDFQTGAVGDSFNGPVGTTTAAAGAFTTLSSTGNTTLGDASGDSVTINGTATFANANPTLSAGTANGVAYLNGSKVVTSGSALTFDGTNLGVGVASPQAKIHATGTIKVATGNAQGILALGDGAGTTVNCGVWRGAANAPTSDGNYLNFGGYDGLVFAVGNAAIGSQSEVGRFTSTGLGIGTSSPATKLQVSANEPKIRITSTANSGKSWDISSGGNTTVTLGHFCIYDTTTDAQRFNIVSGSGQMLLDGSGNLGLGVTPSAWRSGTPAFQIGSAGVCLFADSGITADLGNNTFLNASSQYIYLRTDAASRYRQYQGIHSWLSAASGTAGTAVTFSTSMTLDADGDLGIGTTSPSRKLDVQVASDGIAASFGKSGGTMQPRLVVKASEAASTVTIGTDYAGATSPSLAFETGSIERARIDSSGNLLVGTTSTMNGVGSDGKIGLQSSGASGNFVVQNSGDDNIYLAKVSGYSNSTFIRFSVNGTGVGSVTTNGTVTLYNTTSDQRLKENIVDAPEFGSVIDSIKVRSFDWKTNQSHQRAGLIAQELVTVAPEAVHQPEDSEEMMAVDYSKLVPMLVKEIQSLRKRLADAGL